MSSLARAGGAWTMRRTTTQETLMNPKLLAVALWMACAGTATAQGQAPADRGPIDVVVNHGRIEVPEAVASVRRTDGALVWQLRTDGHRFPPNGIVIDDPRGVFRCGVSGQDARTFRCARTRHEPGVRYKYDVRVLDARPPSGPVALPVLDPWIQND